MSKEMSMSSHGGATLLTLSKRLRHISSAQMSLQRVVIDSRMLVECDVQIRLSQLTNGVNQRLNLEGRRQ